VALELNRVDRIARTYTLSSLAIGGGGPVTPTAVEVALLPPRTSPSRDTTWTTVTYAAGAVTVLLAGPDADPTGAVVVPASADLWMRVTYAPEVDAVKVERITVTGGGASVALPPTPDTVFAALLADPTSAAHAQIIALIEAHTGFGNGNP